MKFSVALKGCIENEKEYRSDNKVYRRSTITLKAENGSHTYADHLKIEMEIPSSSNVKLITECSDTTYTCYEVMKDLIKVSKLPQTLISYSLFTSEQDGNKLLED
ncbi:hypothetical protein Tco_0659707 [Tanacetum coccineum]